MLSWMLGRTVLATRPWSRLRRSGLRDVALLVMALSLATASGAQMPRTALLGESVEPTSGIDQLNIRARPNQVALLDIVKDGFAVLQARKKTFNGVDSRHTSYLSTAK